MNKMATIVSLFIMILCNIKWQSYQQGGLERHCCKNFVLVTEEKIAYDKTWLSPALLVSNTFDV